MKIAFVHYHLNRGGVTRVIAHAAQALANHGHECLAISSTDSQEPLNCPNAVVPELAYLKVDDEANPQDLAKRLSAVAHEHFGSDPDIWHIHNHSLGKNGSLTAAVSILAESKPVLLQIHDFAEDGRPQNYQLLRNQLSSTDNLYPSAPQIHYAVLNSRDFEFLTHAGFPDEQLHLLPNAVDVPELKETDESIEVSQNNNLIVYPTRAIRRKNVGEAILLSVMNPCSHFATTLHPKNPSALKVYNDWRKFAQDNKLTFSFGLGEKHSFPAIIQSSKAILTTSITEGFGLAFLEPFLFEKPLFGRNLPQITKDFCDKGIRFPDLYESIPIPSDWLDFNKLLNELLSVLKNRYSVYQENTPADIEELLKNHLFKNSCIDFGLLPEHYQQEVIAKLLNNPPLINQLTNISPPVVVPSLLKSNKSKIEKFFDLKSYGERLNKLYHSIAQSSKGSIDCIPAKNVLQQFLKPENFNILTS